MEIAEIAPDGTLRDLLNPSQYDPLPVFCEGRPEA